MNTFDYQQLEQLENEVKRDFDYYFIAHNLGKDVEEVMNWDYEKFQKWRLYFTILIGQQSKQSTQLNERKEHLFVFR